MQKTREEMIDALRVRITQLDKALDILYNQKDGPLPSYWQMEAIREELNTFLNWSEGNNHVIL